MNGNSFTIQSDANHDLESNPLVQIHGLDFTEGHIKEALEMDQNYYPEHLQASLELCQSWQKRNADIYSGLLLDRRLVAYINSMFISQSGKGLILRDGFNDVELSCEFMNTPGDPSTSILYLASVAIHPDFRNDPRLKGGVYSLLFTKLSQLAIRGVFLDELCGDVVSSDGLRFVENTGMNPEKRRNSGFGVYSVSLNPFSLKGSGFAFEQCQALYRNRAHQ